jgi:nanoRNase/pAp phosphatase (c-di-AMP/oligoRNAs hydrolase)
MDPAPGQPFIDVNALAARFGGGGHVHAAGARIDLPLEQAGQALEKAVSEALQEAGFVGSGSTV